MTDIEECRRTGLLKDSGFNLDTHLEILETEYNVDKEDLEKYKLNIRAFMDQEEKLLNGNKGKYALFYNGALWRMSVDEINLIKCLYWLLCWALSSQFLCPYILFLLISFQQKSIL